MNTILGSKHKMSVNFTDDRRVPVTIVSAGPCVVTQVRNVQNKNTWTVQIGFDTKKTKNTSKALQGHLKETTKENRSPRYLKELKFEQEPQYKVGDQIVLTDVLAVGDTVDVTGTSKGKGFAGVVKRWNFRGGSKTHGQSDRHRAPGSIGQGTTPGRVYKGKKMAGRMGGETKTIKNLKIISLDVENNMVSILGSVPGSQGTLLSIRRTSPKQEVEAPTVEEIIEVQEGGTTNE